MLQKITGSGRKGCTVGGKEKGRECQRKWSKGWHSHKERVTFSCMWMCVCVCLFCIWMHCFVHVCLHPCVLCNNMAFLGPSLWVCSLTICVWVCMMSMRLLRESLWSAVWNFVRNMCVCKNLQLDLIVQGSSLFLSLSVYVCVCVCFFFFSLRVIFNLTSHKEPQFHSK